MKGKVLCLNHERTLNLVSAFNHLTILLDTSPQNPGLLRPIVKIYWDREIQYNKEDTEDRKCSRKSL